MNKAALSAFLLLAPTLPSSRASPVVDSRIEPRVQERAQSGPTQSEPIIRVFIVLKHQPQREIVQRAEGANALYRQAAETRYSQALNAETAQRAREEADAVTLRIRQQAFQAIDQAIRPDQDVLEGRLRGLGATRIARYLGINMLAAEVPPSAIPALEDDSSIARVFPVERLRPQLANSVPLLGAPAFWSAGYTGQGESVGVLDTGVTTNHPAFAGLSIISQVFLTNGSADPCFADSATDPQDLFGHGTHVAGIVASRGSAGWTNYLGVAKGLGALYNLKVGFKLSKASTCDPSGAEADEADVAAALDWAVRNTSLKIFNLSFGKLATADDDGFAQTIDQYIDSYGLTIAIAAGNYGPGDLSLASPGIAYNGITVANFVTRTTINDSSSRGPTPASRRKPDLAAPGTNVYSTAYNWASTDSTNDDFIRMTGTSMAAPHIAGSAALLASAGVSDALSTKAILINSSDGTGWDNAWGAGPANLDTAIGQLNRDTGTLGPGGIALYEVPLSGDFRASAVWNRHLSGATSYFNLMTLCAYAEDTGAIIDCSDWGQNVEQVWGTYTGKGVLAVSMVSSPLAGVSSELYAVAFSAPSSRRSGAQLEPACAPASAITSGSQFTMTCSVANSGDLPAFSVTGQPTLPAGFSGGGPLSFGNIAPGAVSSVTSTLTAGTADGTYGIRLDASAPPAFGLPPLAGSAGSTATVVLALARPVLVSPASGATGVPQTAVLVWTVSPGASGYDVYLGTSADPLLVGSTTAATYTANLSPGTLMFWRVVAKNGLGASSSVTCSFTTVAASPAQPQYLITTVAGTGVQGYSGDDGPATSARLLSPVALASDSSGNLYIADGSGQVVRRVDANGTITTVAGNGQQGFTPDGAAATSGGLSYPEGIAVDAAGNLYIAEATNWRVRKVSPAGIITTVAGTGYQGSSGDGGPATSAELGLPSGVAVDASGDLWIADTGNANVRKVAPNGIISTVAGDGVYGYSGDGGPATAAELRLPSDLALDSTGNLYIADAGNGLVRKVAPNGIISTVAGDGNPPPPNGGCPGHPSSVSYPSSVALDAAGDIIVGEADNCLVREFTPDGKSFIVAGNGSMGYSGDGGLATGAQTVVSGVLVAASGDIFVADGYSSVVRGLVPLNPSCQYAVDRTAVAFAASGGAVSIRVQTGPECAWGIWGLPGWIAGQTIGRGPATVSLNAAANSGAFRTATIAVAGTAVTIAQADGFCSLGGLYPGALTAPAAGGAESISVSACPDTAWSAVNTPDWVTISGPSSGVGPGVVSLAVSPNMGSARSATLTIGNLPFAVHQLAASPDGLHFVPVAPCRVADTRYGAAPSLGTQETRSFAISGNCGIPATAQAYSLNVTVVPHGALSYLTIWPTGQPQPGVSTLNSWNGIVVANAAIVPAGTNGAVSVYVTDPTDVILDINGYFDTSTGSTSYSFYPATPCRVVDTRWATGEFGGPEMGGATIRDFPIPLSTCPIPATAAGYSLNFTVVPSGDLSYLTTWPTGQPQPNVSTLNSWTGKVVANAAIVPAGTNESVSVYVTDPTQVIMDINGYFGAPGSAGALTFYPVTPCRVADTRWAAGAFGGPEMEGPATRSFAIPASACNIPATAAAYSLNVTVVPDGYLSYLTTWPAGAQQPVVSTLNSWDGSVVANAAIVPAGTDGAIEVYVTNPTHVILDIDGYFAP